MATYRAAYVRQQAGLNGFRVADAKVQSSFTDDELMLKARQARQ